MSSAANKMIPIHASELEVGRPLPWAIYDATGVLLLNQGVAPASAGQVALLISRGACRTGKNTGETRPAATRPDLPPMTASRPEVNRSAPEGDPIPFDDMALLPGEMLQVQDVLSQTAHMPVALLGYMRNLTLIVTNPMVAGKVIPVREGALLDIKAFSGTTHFTFRSKVLKAHTQPLCHLHLEYPKMVYSTRIRKALRAVVNLPAVLHDLLTGDQLPVVLKDLSVGGAKLVLPSPVAETATRFALSFKIKIADDLEEEIRVELYVRARETADEKGKPAHTMGVQFHDLTKEHRLMVMTLVYRQQLKKG